MSDALLFDSHLFLSGCLPKTNHISAFDVPPNNLFSFILHYAPDEFHKISSATWSAAS